MVGDAGETGGSPGLASFVKSLTAALAGLAVR